MDAHGSVAPERRFRTNIAAPGLFLSDEDRRMLEVESSISPAVIAGRGYWTATKRSEVPDVFPEWQRRLGLVIPSYSPSGVTTYQLRPKTPRKDKKGEPLRYETPHEGGYVLDVHPSMHDAARDPSIPFWLTEGIKKGDSLTSRGCCTGSLVGVWMFAPKNAAAGELLPCFDHVALSGRLVYVVFDSDVVMVQASVQDALERLVGALEGRGATVRVVYLPEVGDA